MRVRCPACKQLHTDPGNRFTCAGCGRTLAWQAPQLWLTEQLSLFHPEGAVEELTLPLIATPPRTPETTAISAESHRSLSLLSDSIALVTALLPLAAGQDEAVPAILADQASDRLLGLTATTAWVASALVQLLDEHGNGAGTQWLQGLALGLAADDPK